ncbi:MAG: hydroxyacid dehydrogenase [Candidatus Micrarchaeia archaeon]
MKIVVSDHMGEDILDELSELGEVVYMPKNLEKEIEDAHVLIVRSGTKVTKELLKNAKRLELVVRAGVGVDNIDVKECERKGIKVANTPDASSISVAELTIGLMIALLRNIIKAHIQMTSGIWDRKALVGRELYGKTLGIIGFGRIGRKVAERAVGMGMRVIAYDPHLKESELAELVDFDTLLRNSDIISLHTALTEQTRNMINAETIKKMKNGAYIINAARGALIDEDALYDALVSGKIAGAALDVTVEEPHKGKLLEVDNVIFSSHIGASTIEAQERVGEEVVVIVENHVKKRMEKK